MGIIQGREKMSGVTKENLLERIQNYFESGGLWNPECMEHDKVQELIFDMRSYLRMVDRLEEKV
jgi:hypothetical protein